MADRDQIKREVEWLWQFHLRRLKTGAPVHQLFDRAIFSQQPPLNVVECRQCGTVFRNPRETASDVVEVYEGEEPTEQALASLFAEQHRFFVPRVEKLSKMCGGVGSALEVGSYIGAFLKAASDKGWDAVGLDVNPRANEFARQQGVQVVESPLDDYAPNRTFDAVVLWNCFDQLPEPSAALQHARRLLSPKGCLAIRVPNGAAYVQLARMPSAFSRLPLAWNNLASFPYRHGFTPDSLTRMLEAHNFRVERVELDTLVPISSKWTRSWARWEERILKTGMQLLKTRRLAPWFEVYARST